MNLTVIWTHGLMGDDQKVEKNRGTLGEREGKVRTEGLRASQTEADSEKQREDMDNRERNS